jgi:hypothetical protein
MSASISTERRNTMSVCRLMGTAAILIAITGPAMAQHVIYEPGYCAQYYPDANCQNEGPNNPLSADYHSRVNPHDALPGDRTVGTHGKRSRTHRSEAPAVRPQ